MEQAIISKEEALNTIGAIRSDISDDRKIAKKKKKFMQHLFIYIAVILLLWCINWYSLFISDNYSGHPVWWAIFPTLGWGIGILVHFIKTR